MPSTITQYWPSLSLSALATLVALLFVAPAKPAAPTLSGCPSFPVDHILNTAVDTLPVHPKSAAFIASLGATKPLRTNFGSGLYQGYKIGFPWTNVPATQKKVPLTFRYASESDPGPYPIPLNVEVEVGTDAHVLVVERDNCILYEVFSAQKQANGSWAAGSGAIFNLRGYKLRPKNWTSADAAGLPILPLLVRYKEVSDGEIHHALRISANRTRKAFVWPARHYASTTTDPNVPAMGQRLRLKAKFNISTFSPQNQVILRAMKKYGVILADNGAQWFMDGVPNESWNNDMLFQLRSVKGSDFEVVDVSSLMIDPDSGKAKSPTAKAGVVNAASQQAGPLAPGLIISIFGSGLGNTTSAALRMEASGRLATSLGGTRVLFDGVPAALTFTGAGQINAIVPYALAGRSSATLEVEYQGVRSAPFEVDVNDAAPALFTVSAGGTGQGAILNQDFSVNSAANPAQKGSVVMLYATGQGLNLPAGSDGQIATAASWSPRLPVSVRIDGQSAEVEYAGAAPGLVSSVMQVNVQIPQNVANSGDVPIELSVGEESSQADVTIAIQ